MFHTIASHVPADPDLPPRARTLTLLRRVLDGTFYDALPYEFHEERTSAGEYIPLRLRRPSVRYALPRIVVENSVALLFSNAHFPTLQSTDASVRDALAALLRNLNATQLMTEAAVAGSIGTACIQLRILRGRPFAGLLDPAFLTPVWDPEAPDTLLSVIERYKVSGAALIAAGHAVRDPRATYWFNRRWTTEDETWFQPQPLSDQAPPTPDPERSIHHALGFVPLVWIRNLPDPGAYATGSPDGASTFRAAIETGIEIDYQLSQAGRGLKYSSDPTLLIKEPAGIEGDIVRGAGNALVLSEKGDARLLEIGGTAAGAVLDYVRALREFALEAVGGNRADASRLTAPTSGRALEMMNQGLIWLADNLRTSYGDGGLLPLARMLLRAHARYPLQAAGRVLPPLDPDASLTLAWPRWYPDTAADRAQDAATLATLRASGHLSQETALRILAPAYGLDDVPAELARIRSEQETSA